jgi:hypothetical protein
MGRIGIGNPRIINGRTLKNFMKEFAADENNALCSAKDGDCLQIVIAHEQGNSDSRWIILVDSKLNFRVEDEQLLEMLYCTIQEKFGTLEEADEDDDFFDENDDDCLPIKHAIDSWYFFGHCYHPVINYGIGKCIDFSKHIIFEEICDSAKLVEKLSKKHKIDGWKVAEQLSYYLQAAADEYRITINERDGGKTSEDKIDGVPIVDGLYIEKFVLWEK